METDVGHDMAPTAGMLGECGEEIGVVEFFPKDHGRLTSPALYADVHQLHQHGCPVKASYAVSKGDTIRVRTCIGIYI